MQMILEALAKIRQEVGTVPKDGTNPHFGYSYASERGIQAALRELLDKHGIIILPSIEPGQKIEADSCGVTHFVAEYTIAHVSGEVWPEKLRVAASGSDRGREGQWGDKGAWKANTGAYKYLLSRLFMLDTGDDPEGDKNEGGPRPDRGQPERTPPARRSAPSAPVRSNAPGACLSESRIKELKVYAKGFKAAEIVHGKGKEKFAAINRSCKVLGFQKLEQVPDELGEELIRIIEDYPNWHRDGWVSREDPSDREHDYDPTADDIGY